MEPRVQFGLTSDGVNIAYWAMGQGRRPLIVMPANPWSHLQLEWSIPEVARWYEGLAQGRMVVRYDGRGFGLSQRDVPSMSLEAQVHDLETVIGGIGAEEVDLFAGQHSGPVAVAYAARRPERVQHLVLFCSYADGALYGRSPLTQATRPIIHQDWDFYSELVSRLLLGWSEHETAHRFAELVRECTTPEIAAEALSATTLYDVTPLLPEVRAPTLVVHRRELRIATLDNSRALAAGIPNARLRVLEGTSVAPYLGDAESVAYEVDAFLSDRPSAASSPVGVGTLRTIFFTDVEGSAIMTRDVGDERARDVLRKHEQIVREELQAHGGTEIKAMGDGFMASFGSAVAAIECAIAVQQRLSDYNASADHEVQIRVGMNAGEPIAEDGDLFGTAVIVAARIGGQAKGGEIYVSDVVRQLTAGKDFEFVDSKDVVLRGFDEPTRIHSVRWERTT